MIDVKKLVTGFLVLAVAISASALLVSNISAGNASVDATSNTAIAAANDGTEAPLGGNAFLPTQTQDTSLAEGAYLDPSVTDPALASATAAMSNDPNNLTNILANTYLGNLATTNPNGPSTDANGNPVLTPPDPNSVISEFMSSSTNANVPIPNWDVEADQVPVRITTSSPAALAAYGIALDQILQQDFVQTNLEGMLTNNTDPSFEPFVAGKVQTALQDISGLQTPSAAVPLEKSLIKTLVYAKSALALAQNASGDPLKTELTLEAEDAKYQAAVADFQTQIQNAQSQNLFSDTTMGTDAGIGMGQPSENKMLASIQSILGIPVAHAQIGVFDFITHLGVWAQVSEMIKNEIKDVVIQLIKNMIVFLMQKTIFAAIKGSGAPAFIQQWGTTLANALQTSALNALNRQMQCVGAAPFAPQLNLTLKAPYLPGNNNICAVQFNAQLGNNLNNLKGGFYNNFSNGGWISYGTALTPDYNYFGNLFFVSQAIGVTAANSQNSAQAKATANQGFHGSAVCDDGSNPNGSYTVCQNSAGAFAGPPPCAAGYQSISFPNDGTCSDGTEPLVQTPGTVFNNMVGSAVDGNFKLITSANSWAGLASGLFVSILQEVLNSLATTAISGEQGLLQQAANGGGATPTGQTTYTVGATSSPDPIACNPPPEPDLSGNPLVAVIHVSGGEVVNSTGVSTPSYTWTPPAGGTLSTTSGDTVTATFNAPGIYQVAVTDTTDNVNTTCQVTIPVPLQ